MTKKKKKKQGTYSFLWIKPISMALVFFLIIGFFTGTVEKFLEQSGGIDLWFVSSSVLSGNVVPVGCNLLCIGWQFPKCEGRITREIRLRSLLWQ